MNPIGSSLVFNSAFAGAAPLQGIQQNRMGLANNAYDLVNSGQSSIASLGAQDKSASLNAALSSMNQNVLETVGTKSEQDKMKKSWVGSFNTFA